MEQEGETYKHEAEDLATLEGDLEAGKSVDVAKVRGLNVAGRGDHHADVAAGHRGGSADEEGDGGEGEDAGTALGPRHVDSTENDDSEESTEDGKSAVLFLEEGDGTLRIIILKLASD